MFDIDVLLLKNIDKDIENINVKNIEEEVIVDENVIFIKLWYIYVEKMVLINLY